MKFSGLKIESYKRGIALSSLFNLISRILLFLQSIVVAHYFGAGPQTDVYFFCFQAVTLFSIFINALDSSVLIPEAMRLRESDPQRAITFLNSFIWVYAVLGSLAAIAISTSPIVILTASSNFSAITISEHMEIVLLMAPLFALMIVTTLLVNILMSYKYFTIPMIVSISNGLFSLILLVLFHDEIGIRSAVVGLVISYGANLIFLVLMMRKNLRWKFNLSLPKLERLTIRNIFFAQAGSLTTLLSAYIPMYVLSSFEPGIITALTFGQKTSEMPQQVITNQAASVFGIKLNELFARGEEVNVSASFVRLAELLLFLLIPLSAILFLSGQAIIDLLYQHGNFDVGSAQRSADFFRYFALLLPMLAINTLVSRLFIATRKIREGFLYQVAFNVALILFIFFGVNAGGPLGYPIALIGLQLFNIVFCLFLVRWVAPFVEYWRVLRSFLIIGALNLLIYLLISRCQGVLSGLPHLAIILIQSLAYLSILLVSNHFYPVSLEGKLIVNSTLNKIVAYVRTRKQ